LAGGKIVLTAVRETDGAPDVTTWLTVSSAPYTAGSTAASLVAGLQGAIDAALADHGYPAGTVLAATDASGHLTLSASSSSPIRALKINVPAPDPNATRQTTGLGFSDGAADSPITGLVQDVQAAIDAALAPLGYAADTVHVYVLGDVSAD